MAQNKQNESPFYTALTIETTELGVDLLSAALESVGAEKQEIIERREDVEQFLADNAKHWDYVENGLIEGFGIEPQVRVYIPESDAGHELRARIDEKLAWLAAQDFGFDIGTLKTSETRVNNEDWATNWKKYFKPIEIGDKLVVCPEWERENLENSGRTVLYIDPGMVFGSGSHETTSLCLGFLSEVIHGGERVLDAGCGSGILSIGALLFGAKSALGVDIDAAAEHVAMRNASFNGIGADRLTILTGDVIEDEETQRAVGEGYDVLCSNIIANVVIALGAQAPRLVKKGGLWIASGIILDRQADVEDAMRRAGFTVVDMRNKGEWVAILARKD